MKKLLLSSLVFMVLASVSIAQNVGIGTESPQRKLDVNGNLKVSGLENKSSDNTYDRIIVADANGNIDYKSSAETGSYNSNAIFREKVEVKGRDLSHDYSDAIVIDSEPLQIMIDPQSAAGVSVFDVHFKLNELLTTENQTYAIIGGTGNLSENAFSKQGLWYYRTNIVNNGFTKISGISGVRTQESPIVRVTVSLPYLKQVYELIITANNGTNPGGANSGSNWPDYSVFVKRLY